MPNAVQLSPAANHEISNPSPAVLAVEWPALSRIPLDQIDLDPDRPRRATDGPDMDELTASIAATGMITPVLVVLSATQPGRYTLRSGERRFNACTRLGHSHILAIVREEPDDVAFGLIENLQRTDLSPLDEAEWVRRLKETLACTDEHLGALLGRSRPSVTQLLAITKLPPQIKTELRALATTPPRDHLVQLAQCVGDDERSVVLEAIKDGTTQSALRARRKGEDGPRSWSEKRSANAFMRAVEQIAKCEHEIELLKSQLAANEDAVALIKSAARVCKRVIREAEKITANANSAPAEVPSPGLH